VGGREREKRLGIGREGRRGKGKTWRGREVWEGKGKNGKWRESGRKERDGMRR